MLRFCSNLWEKDFLERTEFAVLRVSRRWIPRRFTRQGSLSLRVSRPTAARRAVSPFEVPTQQVDLAGADPEIAAEDTPTPGHEKIDRHLLAKASKSAIG